MVTADINWHDRYNGRTTTREDGDFRVSEGGIHLYEAYQIIIDYCSPKSMASEAVIGSIESVNDDDLCHLVGLIHQCVTD